MRMRVLNVLFLSAFWNIGLALARLTVEHIVHSLMQDSGVPDRPRTTSSKPVSISASASLAHIHSLNVKNAELDLTVWIELAWTDPRLKWRFEATARQVVLPGSKVWTPDITISNAVGKITPIHRQLVASTATGSVRCVQAYRTTIGCITNTTATDQICTLMIGSWSYDHTDVDIYAVTENFTVTEEFFNHDWNLMESYLERVNQTRFGAVYPNIAITMKLRQITLEEHPNQYVQQKHQP